MTKESYRESRLEKAKKSFLKTQVNRGVLVAAFILTIVYFYLITLAFPIGNKWLFGILIFGEVFHVFQILMYIYTVWDMNYMPPKDDTFVAPVDVFITVCGEPVEIVEETARAAKNMDYPTDVQVHILNDSYVAKKENWEDYERLAEKLGINCITRTVAGGAKAGNINNGFSETNNPYVVIFDADHVPHKDFLLKTMPYFADPKVAFVQSPQFYKNFELNMVTRSSWEQQELFFGPICKGKNRLNSATMCGTNMVLKREAMDQVGGIADSIAEDFLTGVFLHGKGWKSVYVPEVLAEGLAPEDFLSYFKQQFRWARGALDVIFTHNVLFRRGLTLAQRLQYFSSVSFYLSGIIVVLDALIPVVYFFTGLVPFTISTMTLAAVFIPYMFLTLYILQQTTNFKFTFRALLFSMSGFNIHIKAFWAAITFQKSSFSVTSKRQLQGNFLNLVIPQILYVVIVAVGIVFALIREGLSASLITNTAWALLNVGVFIPFIQAALPSPNPKLKRMGGDRVIDPRVAGVVGNE